MPDPLHGARQILKKFWGYDQFRPQQEKILSAVFSRDNLLAVMATGGGKSICFQVPAVMAGGLTWIFSPLLSLMKDQQEGLTRLGINAVRLTSEYTPQEQKQMLHGLLEKEYGLVYVSPEQLKRPEIRDFWIDHPPSYVVIDEAHCISQWGHDFRPTYWQIGNYLLEMKHGPILAFTATASEIVQDEIIHSLKGENWHKVVGSFVRDNIRLNTYYGKGKAEQFIRIIESAETPMIIFAGSRKRVEQVCNFLQRKYSWQARAYHAGMEAGERVRLQNDYIDNKIEVLVSTCAFGMGVDKPNIRTVIHIDLPPGIDSFYQEIGRAGRDGKLSSHYLLQTDSDSEAQMNRLLEKFPDRELAETIWPGDRSISYREQIDKHDVKIVNTVYEHWWVKEIIEIQKDYSDWNIRAVESDFENAWKQLEEYKRQILERFHYLEKYVHVSSCKMQYLCGYFSEEAEPCGHCDSCRSEESGEKVLVSRDDMKLLQAIAEIEGKFKIKGLANHLHSDKKNPHLPAGGVLKNIPFPDIMKELHHLQKEDYIRAPRMESFRIYLSGKGRHAIEESRK